MLELRHISKSFPGVKALQDVSLSVAAGEVHAICGENGAGKSTLMSIVTGNLQPDAGELVWKGQEVHIQGVAHAQQLGIGIVYQERSLVNSLSVAENIFPENQPRTKWGWIDFKSLYQNARTLLHSLELENIAPQTPVGRLSAPQQQMVEIAKALAGQPRLLILDEPTASLTTRETDTLFRIITSLKAKGIAIIYISHRMAEIKGVANRVSVLKDGCYEGTFFASTTPTDEIVRRMVGRDLHGATYRSDATATVSLELEGVSGSSFSDVSLTLHKGEILGLAGLLGSGRTELAEAVFGAGTLSCGRIIRAGAEVRFGHPADAIRNGIAYLPDDRKHSGLFLEQSVAANIISARLHRGWYQKDVNNQIAEKYREKLSIRTPSVQQEVRRLSGGNQQKVVLGKWLHTNPEVLMVNEPTHGVDVGAKSEIYRQLKDLTAAGKSILLLSSELPELLLLSDRIGVMYNGKLVAVLDRLEATEEKITALASGLL